MHLSVPQSLPAAQSSPTTQRFLQVAPPQSIAVSVPFLTPFLQEVYLRSADGVVTSHWAVAQSLPSRHVCAAGAGESC